MIVSLSRVIVHRDQNEPFDGVEMSTLKSIGDFIGRTSVFVIISSNTIGCVNIRTAREDNVYSELN